MVGWDQFIEKINGVLQIINLNTVTGKKTCHKRLKANQKRKKKWKDYLKKAKKYYDQGKFRKAKKIVKLGLRIFPDKIALILVASDLYRISKNHNKSLKYAKLLIAYHPDIRDGYERAAQDLVALSRFEDAQAIIQAGLEVIANDFSLLILAIDIYHACKDHEKSLEFAELLIIHHPGDCNGYGRATQELVALKRFEEAKVKIKEGLEQFPRQNNLLAIASDVFLASKDLEKSLEYAELLIKRLQETGVISQRF